MLQHLERWARRALDRILGREPPYLVARVTSRPRWRSPMTVYVVGNPDHAWCAVFTCPCGCGDEVALNLLQDVRQPLTSSERRAASAARASLVPTMLLGGRPSVRRRRGTAVLRVRVGALALRRQRCGILAQDARDLDGTRGRRGGRCGVIAADGQSGWRAARGRDHHERRDPRTHAGSYGRERRLGRGRPQAFGGRAHCKRSARCATPW